MYVDELLDKCLKYQSEIDKIDSEIEELENRKVKLIESLKEIKNLNVEIKEY